MEGRGRVEKRNSFMCFLSSTHSDNGVTDRRKEMMVRVRKRWEDLDLRGVNYVRHSHSLENFNRHLNKNSHQFYTISSKN